MPSQQGSHAKLEFKAGLETAINLKLRNSLTCFETGKMPSKVWELARGSQTFNRSGLKYVHLSSGLAKMLTLGRTEYFCSMIY